MAREKEKSPSVYKEIAREIDNFVGSMTWGRIVPYYVGPKQRRALQRLGSSNETIREEVQKYLEPEIQETKVKKSIRGKFMRVELIIRVRYDV